MEKSKAKMLTSILHEDSTPSNVRMPSGKYGNLECVAVRNSKANPKGLNFCTLKLHYKSPPPSSSLHTRHIPHLLSCSSASFTSRSQFSTLTTMAAAVYTVGAVNSVPVFYIPSSFNPKSKYLVSGANMPLLMVLVSA